MSTTDDELTGLHNRRSFLSLLRQQVGFSNDRQTLLALLVVDMINPLDFPGAEKLAPMALRAARNVRGWACGLRRASAWMRRISSGKWNGLAR